MAIIAGWGRGGWGDVTQSGMTGSAGSVTVTAITNVDVNVTGVVGIVTTTATTQKANAFVTLTTNEQLSCDATDVNVYGLIITGQTTDWKEVA